MEKRKSEYNFEDKWSHEVAAFGFTQVPNLLLMCQGHLGLTDGETVTLMQLLTFWYKKENPVYPSISRVAKRSGKGYSTTQRRLNSLESKGFVERKRINGTSTRYDLRPCVVKLYKHQSVCKELSHKRESFGAETTHVPLSKTTYKEYAFGRRRTKNTPLKISDILRSNGSNQL